MADALEQAAQAFDTAMGNSRPAARQSSSNDDGPTEVMFASVGELEVDEDSPSQGGGDDDLPSRVKPEVAKAFRDIVQDDGDEQNDGDDADGAEDENNADADADADDADGKDDDENAEEDDFYEVVIDGERVEVGLREALDGYMRQETFHRRLNALNEVKQAVRTEAVNVLEARNKYIALIDDMQSHLDQLIPPEPDWDKEYAANPQAARELQKRFDEAKKTREALNAEKERVNREQAEQDERQRLDYIETENAKILRNNPSWKDEKVMKRDLSLMMETGTKAGFSEEEIRGVYDSRYVQILLKAARYDRLQAAKPQPVRRGTKPTKPGAGSTRTAPKGSQAMKNLSRTGSVDAAAAVFGEIISDKPRSRRR